MDGPILSFLQPKGRQPQQPEIVKHLDIQVHHSKKPGAIDALATGMLVLVGLGAVWAFSAFGALTAGDWLGTAAFTAWNLACALAIIEHFRNQDLKRATGSDQEIIKKAIEQFTKP